MDRLLPLTRWLRRSPSSEFRAMQPAASCKPKRMPKHFLPFYHLDIALAALVEWNLSPGQFTVTPAMIAQKSPLDGKNGPIETSEDYELYPIVKLVYFVDEALDKPSSPAHAFANLTTASLILSNYRSKRHFTKEPTLGNLALAVAQIQNESGESEAKFYRYCLEKLKIYIQDSGIQVPGSDPPTPIDVSNLERYTDVELAPVLGPPPAFEVLSNELADYVLEWNKARLRPSSYIDEFRALASARCNFCRAVSDDWEARLEEVVRTATPGQLPPIIGTTGLAAFQATQAAQSALVEEHDEGTSDASRCESPCDTGYEEGDSAPPSPQLHSFGSDSSNMLGPDTPVASPRVYVEASSFIAFVTAVILCLVLCDVLSESLRAQRAA